MPFGVGRIFLGVSKLMSNPRTEMEPTEALDQEPGAWELLETDIGTSADPAETMQAIWQRELLCPSAAGRCLRGRQVLLVGGFLNELGSRFASYFRDALDELADLGLPASCHWPLSGRPVEQNARGLAEVIEQRYQQSGLPLIVIAHSKAAAEVLYLALTQPSLLVEGRVNRIVLVQAAVGGSVLAMQPAGNPVSATVFWLYQRGLESMVPVSTKSLMERAYRTLLLDHPVAVAEFLSSRIYYVRSRAAEPSLSPAVRLLQLTCPPSLIDALREEENDGVLTTSEQLFPLIGRDLGVIEADHVSLFIQRLGNLTAPHRRGFVRSILVAVSMPSPPEHHL